MYLKFFEIAFIILSIVFVTEMILLDCGITKHMKPMRASDFVSSVAVTLILYVINALVLVFLFSGISRIIMLGFAAMPFIVGKFAEYKYHKIFTTIQNLIVVCGIIYIVNLLIAVGA